MSPEIKKPEAAGGKSMGNERARGAGSVARGWFGWRSVSPVSIRRGAEGVRVYVEWRRLVLWLVAAGMMAAVAVSLGAWLYVYYYRGVKEATYWQVALPWRLEEYRKLRGAHAVATAKRMLNAAEWTGAYLNLRIGLAKDPANREGRMLLAQFYMKLRRPELAERVLTDGIVYRESDDAYLRSVFQYLLQQRNDARVIALAESVVNAAGVKPERRRTAAFFAATAEVYRGNFDRAEEWLDEEDLGRVVEARLLRATMEWGRGFRELAVVKLEQLRREHAEAEDVAEQLTHYYLALGRKDDARRLILLRQVARPEAFGPRLGLLRVLNDEGARAEAAEVIAEIFRDFPGDHAGMLGLAGYAAEAGDPALARRVYAHCKAAGMAWDAAAVFVVEAEIVAGRHEAALEVTRELLRENPEWGRRYHSVFNGLQSVALHGLGDRDTARLFMRNFLGQGAVSGDQLVATARRLEAVGATDEARALLVQAVEAEPQNQAALTRLVERELAAGRMEMVPAAIGRLLGMRRTAPALLEAVRRELAEERWRELEGRAEALDALAEALAAQR